MDHRARANGHDDDDGTVVSISKVDHAFSSARFFVEQILAPKDRTSDSRDHSANIAEELISLYCALQNQVLVLVAAATSRHLIVHMASILRLGDISCCSTDELRLLDQSSTATYALTFKFSM